MMSFALVFLLFQPTSSPSPRTAVQVFYGYIIKHHPLGIPKKDDKRVLWPLLSSRLTRVLDTAQACEDDYFRRQRRRLQAGQLKPEISWLEDGLFSGPVEMALPAEVKITRVVPLKDGRVHIHLRFTYRETFETYGRPPNDSNTFQWTGAVLVVLEGGRYVIDDFVRIDDETGKKLPPLSKGFPECQGSQWVGHRGRYPYRSIPTEPSTW